MVTVLTTFIMNSNCYKCDKEVSIIIEPSGPHLKAVCPICKEYIKFLNKKEKKQFEVEEDNKQ